MILEAVEQAPHTAQEQRKHSGPIVGRLKVRQFEDYNGVFRRARTMPWWRPGTIIAGNDSRYWVFVLPGGAR